MVSEKREKFRSLVCEGIMPSGNARKMQKCAAFTVDVLNAASAHHARNENSQIVETEHYERLPTPAESAQLIGDGSSAGLQHLLVQMGAGSLIPDLAPYISKFKDTLAEDCEVLDNYYAVLRAKLVRLRNGARISTGELQRLSIAITKIAELRRKAFLLPFGAINPHAVKQQNAGQQHLHLHNFGNNAVQPRKHVIDSEDE